MGIIRGSHNKKESGQQPVHMSDKIILNNLLNVKERIKNVSIRSGRLPDSVRLVAVSKKISPEQIKTAIDGGALIFGENYIQEAQNKISLLGRKVKWHFIGHLQSNKAKYAVELFDMIHSVDNYSLAEMLDKEAKKKAKTVPILIQVNISGEQTKHGLDPGKIFKLIEKISILENLRIKGLMTMPPWSQNPEDSRPYFVSLRKLRDELEPAKPENVSLSELSMGMSSDFEVAIEEGATIVRIGTSIFGPRGC